uniref:Uncharacterized protein n=1 Tax=Anguilla anguilla TaxID=7936 RepID=A0A0E9XSS8_ANGAN
MPVNFMIGSPSPVS